MAADKQYCGSAWQRDFPDGGTLLNVELDIDKLNAFPVKSVERKDGSTLRLVKVTVARRREVDERSKATHTVYLNDYVPQAQSAQSAPQAAPARNDLPF